MSLVELTKEGISRKDGCPFCDYSFFEAGTKFSFGSGMVHKTGPHPSKDWFANLQGRTPSDEFSLQVMPVGHLEGVCEAYSNVDLARNMGEAIAIVSYAAQKVRMEDWKEENGIFRPNQIICGKCFTPENTQPHLHVKVTFFSGSVGQAFPIDAGWTKKPIYEDEEGSYVRGDPVEMTRLSKERFNYLFDRLVHYCNPSNTTFVDVGRNAE